jgi:hypothetical protein
LSTTLLTGMTGISLHMPWPLASVTWQYHPVLLSRLEALDNLVISTVFSVSTKLCLSSAKLIRRLQDSTDDKEQLAYLDTLV